MEKIKCYFKNLRIIPTFTLYTLIAVLFAIFITECITSIVSNFQMDIAFEYSDIVKGYTGEKLWGENEEIIYFSESDSNKIQTLQNVERFAVPLTYVLCCLFSAILFYRHKIKTPLFLLTSSTSKITINDLDFSLQYDTLDEMGELCRAFEKMRFALDSNNHEIWRQMNDRKRLNAAFSHDLRTPLTVLEGNLDILQKYLGSEKLSFEDVTETYIAMSAQIERLKSYVSSMNTLQRLEDVPVVAKRTDTLSFINTLEHTANIICDKKKLIFKNKASLKDIKLDAEIVIQVFENILANAIRYAKTTVLISCEIENNLFIITVTDDGNGFDDKALKCASDPFYTTEKKADNVHFGIGLNICKILCKRHGGNIALSNSKDGGGYVTVSFGI